MKPTPPPSDWPARVLHAGAAQLRRLGPLPDAADPHGTVSSRSRLLCAGLSELARVAYAALGGTRHADQVARTATLLSLVTKIDDQVIDSPAFHGGWRTDRGMLRRRTRRWLAPTLDSILTATPATADPRCEQAAELGRALRVAELSPPRRDHLLEVIARGWEIQVEAVATYTDRPCDVPEERVAAVTADISGVWLLMIALCGTLPRDAARGLTPEEERAFFAFGGPIQRADALADLVKDTDDGLIATVPGQYAFRAAGDRYLDAARQGDVTTLYRLVAGCGADLVCLPGPGELGPAARALAGLGELPSLLHWIHGFLLSRYLDHPACARRRDDPAFFPHAGPRDEFAALYGPDRAAASMPTATTPSDARCSGR